MGLPTIRRTVYPLQYSVNMTPTPYSIRYSPNGSFLTTANTLQTMDTLMHNFKGGPNLVKDGEPEYDTLKQDSILHGNITATLKKLPHTPFMQSLDLEKESIASFVLQTWSPKICNIIESSTRNPQNQANPPSPTNSPLSSICRPMLKSSESKSLLALAKALLSLQRVKQAQPALKRENLYFALRDSFKLMILKFLEEKGITILKKEEKTEEELDMELMKIALKEENKDKCFLTIAETLKAPLWVFEGKVIQSKEGGMKFEEDLAKLYQPQGKNSSSLAIYYSPTTSDFFRVALIDPQGLNFLTSCQDSELRNVELELFSPGGGARSEIKALLDTKAKFVTDKLRTLPKMRQ